ncbi:MAG TPA: hypothetical protein VIU38_06160, partial [Anaerolineales bacterium]
MPASRAATSAAPRADRGQSLAHAAWMVAPLLLTALGIVLRLQRYFLGRSFRNDEAALALAIQGHSLQELISQPLPGGLTAPVGFLVLERLIISAFGNSDYVFRLLPLIA